MTSLLALQTSISENAELGIKRRIRQQQPETAAVYSDIYGHRSSLEYTATIVICLQTIKKCGREGDVTMVNMTLTKLFFFLLALNF